MRIGIMSDLHLFNKTGKIKRALKKLEDADVLLIVGDLADRACMEQYDLLYSCIRECMPDIDIYCVSGNHDKPLKDDTNYRYFEKRINPKNENCLDECGAIFIKLGEGINLIGLNPLYYQKQFYFPDKGRQITFLEDRLKENDGDYNIVMCHPPLIGHNPQRGKDGSPYIQPEQDYRIQKIIDRHRNVIFVSGHTHAAPSVEEAMGNWYINDGAVVAVTDKKAKVTQGGVVTYLIIEEDKVDIEIKAEGC